MADGEALEGGAVEVGEEVLCHCGGLKVEEVRLVIEAGCRAGWIVSIVLRRNVFGHTFLS